MIGTALLLVVVASALALLALLAVGFIVLRRHAALPDDGRFDGVKDLATTEKMRLKLGRAPVLHGFFRGRSALVRWRTNPERTELSVATTCRVLEVRAASDDTSRKAVAGAIRRTGDHAFDEAVVVRGKDAPAALALLDQETRARLRETAAGTLTLEAGDVGVRTDGLALDPAGIVQTLTWLSALADRLETLATQSVPARLAAMAGSDRVPGVRRRVMEILVETYGNTEFAAEAARRAIGDPDSGVRAQAAPLGESGLADEALAAAVRDEQAPEKDRREALARAAAVLDRDDILLLYEYAISSRIPALQRDGISGFARLRHGAGVERLARLPQETKDELTLADLAEALTQIAGPGAETALVSLLELPMPSVQALAARGLGKIGSPAAIARLQPIASLVVGPPEVRESAANAIAAIRTRHPGAA